LKIHSLVTQILVTSFEFQTNNNRSKLLEGYRAVYNSKSGRRTARIISRTMPRWWAPKLPGSKAVTLTRCACTKRPSARLAQATSFTTKRSHMSALRPFTTHAGSTSSPTLICATPAPATHYGARTETCGNSTACILGLGLAHK